MKISHFTWTEQQVAFLRTAWAAGRPISQIGEMLGCTRNAVAGKARRLKLAPRPSPIHRKAA